MTLPPLSPAALLVAATAVLLPDCRLIAAEPATDPLLAAPIDTTLAPSPPAMPGTVGSALPVSGIGPVGGVASTTFGSGGLRESDVALRAGLPGGATTAFLDVGTAHGPSLHGHPAINGDAAAIGVETALPGGFSIGVGAAYERDRLGHLAP